MLSLAACLFPSTASALSEHSFKETFGSVAKPAFNHPEGMAVDQSNGDLLVIATGEGEGTISRYHPDGTPDKFSALETNVIDGRLGPGAKECAEEPASCDKVPQEFGLAFSGASEVQVVVDNSGGLTDGDIYVPLLSEHSVDIFASTGQYIGRLQESSEGAFSEPCGVAVDPSGNVYVGDASSHIHKFEPSANPPVDADSSANFEFTPEGCTLAAGAGTTAGFIFPAHVTSGKSMAKLDSSSGEQKYLVDSGPVTTETVNPATGHVYTAVGGEVREYDASGATVGELELVSSFSKAEPVKGIAVDKLTGDVYVARAGSSEIEVWGPAATFPSAITEAAEEVSGGEATLHGTVNPNGVALSECFFEYDTTEYKKEEEPHGLTVPCSPTVGEIPVDSNPHAVQAEISGLNGGTTYHFRLVAANANGTSEGEDEEFTTLGPGVKGESASAITTTEARITGQVNPNGEETSFVVQYVTEAQFKETKFEEALSAPSPPGEVGSGTEFVEVAQKLSGLTPDTPYRFRIVASTATASTAGEGARFATFAFPGSLADGRAYELVSPAQKAGEVMPPEPGMVLGGRLTSRCPVACLPGLSTVQMPMQSSSGGETIVYEGQPFSGGLAPGPNEYLSQRSPSGWETRSLSPTPFVTDFATQGYKGVSDDLDHGIQFQVEPTLSPEAPTGEEGAGFANLYLVDNEDGSLQPLVTAEPPNRKPGLGEERFQIVFSGANSGAPLAPAFSHIVFEANAALTQAVPGPIAPAAPEVGAGECAFVGNHCNLYEWVEGQLRLVNVLPGNTEAAQGAVTGSGRLGGQLAGKQTLQQHPDVDNAISADGSRIFWSEPSGQVYVRVDGDETVKLKDPGVFVTASTDGSEVLLSDGCIYHLEAEEGKECEDLTLDESEIHKGGFQGILGTSENGAGDEITHVYFVDTEVLTGENAEEKSPVKSALNLYAWQEGRTSYIGTLGKEDSTTRFGDWLFSQQDRTAQVSADGRYLAFMSEAPLTGYDNNVKRAGCSTDLNTPERRTQCFEVFEYDAVAETLRCASCNPSGERPLGGSSLSAIRPEKGYALGPQLENLPADGKGTLFFQSQDTLVRRDTNGAIQDVYRWNPDGVGGCERPEGCVALISSGHASDDSMFLDSTPSGKDVFFITRERLVPADQNEQLDLYDARVGGGFPEPGTAPCSGEGCNGSLSSGPTLQGPASAEFSGPGNEKPQKHKKKHKHKKRHKRSAKHNRGGSR